MHSSSIWFRVLRILLPGVIGPAAWAQVAVTDITYGNRQNGSWDYQGGIYYSNDYYDVETLSTAGEDYHVDGALANDVYIRRNTSSGNPNNTTLFFQGDQWQSRYGTSNLAYGETPTDVEDLFLDGNLFAGIRDPFANTGSSRHAYNSNIERIDFHLGTHVVQEGEGIVLFDLENVGNQGDAFRIAAFDEWDTQSATPDAYVGTGLYIAPDSFGNGLDSPTDNSSLEFGRGTYTNGDNVSGNASNITYFSENSLELVGIVIRFTDLGLSAGDTIEGYSLMAADVTAGSAQDLVDWTDSSVYRTNTNRNTHGNVDFMGFGAQLATPVPEPAAYGAWLVGFGTIVFMAIRRRRAMSRSPHAD